MYRISILFAIYEVDCFLLDVNNVPSYVSVSIIKTVLARP